MTPTETENSSRIIRSNQNVLSDQEVLTEGPQYNVPLQKARIKWYRCHVTREVLRELNRRDNFLGFAQTLGFLGVLAAASGVAVYSSFHWPWMLLRCWFLLMGTSGIFWSMASTNLFTIRFSVPGGSIEFSCVSSRSWGGTIIICFGLAILSITNMLYIRPTIRKCYYPKRST